MKKIVLIILFVALQIPYATFAQSYNNEVIFAGSVTELSGTGSWQDEYGPLAVGDLFTGYLYFSFSDITKPVNSTLPHIYDSWYTTDLIIGYSIHFDSFWLTSGYTYIEVYNDSMEGDHIRFTDLVPDKQPIIDQNTIDEVVIDFTDPSGLSIDDALLLPQSFANFNNGYIELTPHLFPAINLSGQIDNVMIAEPVPESSTFLLLGTSLVGLLGLRRRRKTKYF